MKARISLGVIGLGRLGTRIAEELILSAQVHRLYLHNRSAGKIIGCISSLQVLAHQSNSTVIINRMTFKELRNIDGLVICIKDSYDARQLMYSEELPAWLPRSIRTIGLLRDIAGIQELSIRLQNYEGFIFVITNPVDIVTSLLQRACPKAMVLGLGSALDSARFAFFLSEFLGRRIILDQCPIGGEHGGGAIQLRSLWKFKILNNASFIKKVNKAFRASLSLGPKIFNDLGYSVLDCATLFTKDIFYSFGIECERKLLLASVDDGDGPCGWPLETLRPTNKIRKKDYLLSSDELECLARCARAQKQVVDRVIEEIFSR